MATKSASKSWISSSSPHVVVSSVPNLEVPNLTTGLWTSVFLHVEADGPNKSCVVVNESVLILCLSRWKNQSNMDKTLHDVNMAGLMSW